jgi:hypothetical protein
MFRKVGGPIAGPHPFPGPVHKYIQGGPNWSPNRIFLDILIPYLYPSIAVRKMYKFCNFVLLIPNSTIKTKACFSTCQVKDVRFYVSRPSRLLLILRRTSTARSRFSGPRQARTASPGSECSPPDLNHKESLKIY